MPKPRVIYWFRTDLRLHDSPALKAALDLKPECLWPIWTWDVHYVRRARVGSNRFQFLIDCQDELSRSITRLNKKSKLFVLREPPQTLLPKLFKAWRVTHLVFEKDTDAYARARDDAVIKAAKDAGVEVVVRAGRTLWDSDQLVAENASKPTMSITQVQNAAKKLGEPARPIQPPVSLPDPGDTPLDFEHARPEDVPDVMADARNGPENTYESLTGPNGDFAIPTLQELGLAAATTKHRGGETRALEALAEIIQNTEYTAKFEKPNTAPTDSDPAATTLLSPHLHFGSLSCREFYWRVQDVIKSYKGSASKPPTSLIGQLQFRDMYFGAQAVLGDKFSQAYGNSHVRFIPWHLPSRINTETNMSTGTYDIDNNEAETWFQRWKYGRTGFPWIDALMRQLRTEGWIHHLGRHAVACFLTRGGCYVDWERGAQVFEELLIDHEVACNAGNWQWLSCTAFYAQFYRCYSPISFPQKWDKEGNFVRKYVPELARFDQKYIYEPWKAPIADQKKWGCQIKGDGGAQAEKLDQEMQKNEGGLQMYPKPMFDFSRRREICIQAMKTAYGVGLYGNSPQVMDGSWRKLFDDAAEGPTDGKDGPPGAMLAFEEDSDDDGAGEAHAHIAVDDYDQHIESPTSPRGTKHKRSESSSSAKVQVKLDFKKKKIAE